MLRSSKRFLHIKLGGLYIWGHIGPPLFDGHSKMYTVPHGCNVEEYSAKEYPM